MDISVKEIFSEKKYYSLDLNHILNLITFNKKNAQIYGSYAYRGLEYAGDVDIFEVIPVNNIKVFIKKLNNKLRAILKSKDVFITEIKIGEDPRFQVIDKTAYSGKDGKVYGYDYKESLDKLTDLYKQKIITPKEYKEGKSLLKPNPKPLELLEINKKMRYEVLRWTPNDILNGYIKYRGFKIDLEDALKGDGLFKIDYIADVDDRFIEMSNIYDLRIRGKRISRYPLSVDKTLLNDTLTFTEEGKYYKALKRLFTYYHYVYRTKQNKKEAKDMILKIFKILDSDIGKLSQVNSSVGALIALLINKPLIKKNRIKPQIDRMVSKLNNVATVPLYIKHEQEIVNLIRNAIRTKSTNKMVDLLKQIKSKLGDIINKQTYKEVKDDILT